MSTFMEHVVNILIEQIERDREKVTVENILKYSETRGLDKYREMPGFYEKLKEVAEETLEFRSEVKKFQKLI